MAGAGAPDLFLGPAPQPSFQPATQRAPEPVDLRLLAAAGAAWAGVLLATGLGPGRWWVLAALLAVVLTVVLAGLAARALAAGAVALVGVLLVLLVAGGSVTLRGEALARGPVGGWAADRQAGTAVLVTSGDPRAIEGDFGPGVLVRARLEGFTTQEGDWSGAVPVLVRGDDAWSGVRLGTRVQVRARLSPSSERGLAAGLVPLGPPQVLSGPGTALRAAGAVRAAVVDASRGPTPGEFLVPALVTGDDAALPAAVVEDFRAAGMTHLTAVSGTNLTLVLGSLLLVAGVLGVRGRGRVLVGLCGVAAFVLLARPEPSVVRAAAMGTVALLALGSGGRRAGVRTLGAAVLVLLLLHPWFAFSIGFALSVLATAGILLVGPPIRASLARWLPGPLADAVAVPIAAQLACTPLVAAISGQVSLVAVFANLVAAPLVGPATVLGLAGGLLGVVWSPAGVPAGWVASVCAQGLILVARLAASLPVAAVDWGTSPHALLALSALCVLALVAAPALLRHRGVAAALTVALLVVMLRPLPASWPFLGRPGWPPSGWAAVMCDVGQGDAFVLRVAAGAAVLVDAGGDPRVVDRCLERLGVRDLPVVVLTHFHADHVDGLAGALGGRRVGEILVAPLEEPDDRAAGVRALARDRGLPVRVPDLEEVTQLGAVRWRVVAPSRLVSDEPNDASLVLLAEVGGIRILLTGDVEPPSQAPLLRVPDLLPIDVLKVPHHGSRYQDPRVLTSLGARVALVSVGADNTYGHPAPETVAALEASGARVLRTDEDGDVALVVDEGGVAFVRRGPE